MVTISGHNQIIQQSGIVQEVSQQAHSPKPAPDVAAGLQQTRQLVENSTVGASDASERLREKQQRERQKKRDARRRRALSSSAKAEAERDPDAPGRILDTTA